jgi:cysteine desulfurase
MFLFRRKVYLDNNATTPVNDIVRRGMNRVLKKHYGNPSSVYRAARDSAAVMEEARSSFAGIINANSREIIFTSSATEAINQVLISVFEKAYPTKDTIISSPIEHSAVLEALKYLEWRGAKVKFCKVNQWGVVDPAEIETLIDDKTFLTIVMLANNEIGSIQPVKATATISHKKKVPILSDCVQALGKIPVDVKSLDIDYAAFSGHKIHGPKGVGALYVKEGSQVGTFVHGGHQENGLRSGTEGIHNIFGLAMAAKRVPGLLHSSGRVGPLKEKLILDIKKLLPNARVNSPKTDCLPNTISIAFPGINNAQLMAYLDFYGISVSAGSACNTQSDSPSHVLTAIGLSPDKARETLRFSLSERTKVSDISYVTKVMKKYSGHGAKDIGIISPAQLDEGLLFNENAFILDVRFSTDRKVLKGLPGSHEAPFMGFGKYAERVPKNRNIIVVCQAGGNAPIIAYYLRAKGYKSVAFLLSGLAGWRLAKPELYAKHAGQDIVPL